MTRMDIECFQPGDTFIGYVYDGYMLYSSGLQDMHLYSEGAEVLILTFLRKNVSLTYPFDEIWCVERGLLIYNRNNPLNKEMFEIIRT